MSRKLKFDDFRGGQIVIPTEQGLKGLRLKRERYRIIKLDRVDYTIFLFGLKSGEGRWVPPEWITDYGFYRRIEE